MNSFKLKEVNIKKSYLLNLKKILTFPKNLQLKVVIIYLCITLLVIANIKVDSQTVIVGIYENAPKVFTSESGKSSGIFIDIIEYIAKIEGWNLRYVSGTWAEGLSRLEKGEIDLMPDVAYTTDREKIFTFSNESVLSSWSQVYARKGSGIHSLMNLDGKKITILQGSIQQEAFIQLSKGFDLKITLIPVPDYKKAFEMVAKNEADAAISNNFYGLMHTKEFGLEDTAVIFSPTKLMFAAPKNTTGNLLDTIDKHLIDLKKDPQSVYYKSLKRWASEEVQFKLPLWIQILALIVSVALLMSLLGSIVLKHQVNARTHELKQINSEMEQRIIERTAALQKANKKLSSEIKERKNIEKVLIQSEAKYRDLVENANSMILRWTRDGNITFINKYAQQFFGYSEEEIIGKNVIGTIIPKIDPSGHDTSSLVNNIFANPEVYALNENENIRKNGDKVWISWTNRPITDVKGEVTEILSVGNDFTDRKNAEDLLKHTLEELTVAKEKAESADRLKSVFLATMSHELRTPLNSIIGFTGIMLQGLAGELNNEQKKQLDMVQKSSSHLLSLINDVLDLSKIEAGQFVIQSKPFDIIASIKKVKNIIIPLALKKGLSVSTDFNIEFCEFTGDERRIEQILINLLNNSIKFTEKGEINIICKKDSSNIIIAVKDTGIGIKTEDKIMLFKPFHQLDSSTIKKYEGTGLGLSITKRLVEMMKGEIFVESEIGKGSTFTVIFKNTGEK